MNSEDGNDTSDFWRQVEPVLETLRLDATFFRSLRHDGNDWSFVVKTSALFEALVSSVLAAAISDPSLQKVLDGRTTRAIDKLDVVRDLVLLNPASVKLIRSVYDLRGRLSHTVKDLNFSFATPEDADLTKRLTQCRSAAVDYFARDRSATAEFENWYNEAPRDVLWQITGFILHEVLVIQRLRWRGRLASVLPDAINLPLEWVGFLAEPAASQLAATHERDALGYEVGCEAVRLSRRLEQPLTDQPTWKQVFGTALFIKLRDDYVATLVLLRAGLVRQAEAMSRVLLEANLKLAWLEQDADAAISKLASADHRDAKIALEKLCEHELLDGEADEEQVRARIEDLAPVASRFPSIERLCREVLSAQTIYDTMYRGASAAVHTTLKTIDERILWVDDHKIAGLRTGPDLDRQPTTLHAATAQFIAALGLLAQILQADIDTQLSELSDRLATLVPE